MTLDQDHQRLTQVFGELLQGHARKLGSGGDSQSHAAKFAPLRNDLSAAARHRQNQAAHDNTRRSAQFSALIDGFLDQIELWRKAQESTAEEFNLFDVLDVAGDEVRHSRLLAWLLDRRLEKAGTHAQGNLGFRLFLEELKLPSSYAEANYWVWRERSGDESRVDVEIAARGQFLIHIENKIHSEEGPDQTVREWADLVKRANELAIPSGAMHGVFLTLNGIPAENPKFQSLSWRTVAGVFAQFAAVVQPPEVKVFAAHCARALRISCAEKTSKERNGEHDEESIQ